MVWDGLQESSGTGVGERSGQAGGNVRGNESVKSSLSVAILNRRIASAKLQLQSCKVLDLSITTTHSFDSIAASVVVLIMQCNTAGCSTAAVRQFE